MTEHAPRLRVETPVTVAHFRAHLFLMHGEWMGDVDTVKELRECHDLSHKEIAGLDHIHKDAEPEPWSWD